MLRSKTVPSTPRVPTKGLGISSGSAANRFSRCGLAGLFESRCAQQGRRRRERLDHRSKERTRLARPYASPYTRSALPPTVANGGCSQCRGRTSTVGFAAECLKMAQTAEEEQNRATFLQMARVWFALAEKEKRHAPAAMTIQRIKCRSYLLLPQPLPQPMSKLLVSAPGARNARCRSLARRSSCNLCSYAFLHDFEQNRSIHFRCTIKPS